MTTMDQIVCNVQKYFNVNNGSAIRDDKIERCLLATKQWISNKWEISNVAENYKFISLNILPLWNEVMGQSIASLDIFLLHEVVFDIMSCLPSDINDLGWLRIKCKISLKYAGKLITVQKYSRAVTCLDFAEKQMQELLNCANVVQKMSTGVMGNPTIVDMKKNLLICQLYRIEIHFASENNAEAMDSLQNIKLEMSDVFDDVSKKYIFTLCFNFGLRTSRQEKYEESVFWLSQSYEMSDSSAENQVSTLLLLAEAHLMLDSKQHYEKAVIALNKIDPEYKDFNTNLLKLKACIGSEACLDDIRKIILHCYKIGDLIEDKVIQMFYVLKTCKPKCLLHEAMITFESILKTSQAVKIFQLHLNLLLKEGLLVEADEVVKYYIASLSRSVHTAESPSIEAMLHLVESQAISFQNKSMFAKAVGWFGYCIQIVNHANQNTSMLEMQKLKFYQQKCSCFLELGMNEEAKEMLILAKEQMAHHVINKYLRLKLCIIHNDESEAISVIESFYTDSNTMEDSDDIAKILILVAEFALKKLRIKTTIHIFESVIEKLPRAFHIMAVLKCILRLKLQSQSDFECKVDQEWIYKFLPTVCKCLHLIQDDNASLGLTDNSMVTDQVKWIVKVFWNIAHGQKESPLFVHRLLDCCSKMLLLCDPNDTIALLQRNSCILISMTAGLEVVRSSSVSDPNSNIAQELLSSLTKNILENINEFKSWSVKLESMQLGQELSAGFHTMQRILLICEFEVKAILHSHDLEDVFERAVSQPDIDEKTFELLAAIAYRKGNQYYSLTVRSLRAAIGKLLEKPLDYDHLARLYHSLLCIVSAKMESNITYKTDFGKFINEVYELIRCAPSRNFPQSELLWFMTKTWNNSLKLYLKFGRHNEALAWSQLAIGMSDHLVSLKEVYQAKMTVLHDQMSQTLSSYLNVKEN